MAQLGMDFECGFNDPPEGSPGESLPIQGVYPKESQRASPPTVYGTKRDDRGEHSRLLEQVRALKEQLGRLKEAVLKSGNNFIKFFDDSSQISPLTVQHPNFDHQIQSEVIGQREIHLRRVQSLEQRVERLMSSNSDERNGDDWDVLETRDYPVGTRDCFNDIHSGDDFLSPFESEGLGLLGGPDSTESEILARLDAAKAETRTAEVDRDTLLDENEDLRERLKRVRRGYEDFPQQLNVLDAKDIGFNSTEARADEVGGSKNGEEATSRKEVRTAQHKSAACKNNDCEAQLALIRTEHDIAIRQNEEGRRNLATRTAERNGAHQRIRILETCLKESQKKEAQLQAEIRQIESQDRTHSNLLSAEASTCEADIEYLQQELEHAVAAASKAQQERDAARVQIRSMEEENAVANSAAEIANDVVIELQQSLEAANNAALAEREKSEDSRRTQNRLRIERETVRIEVSRLERELNAAHQVSKGIVRHGNTTVGDLVRIREERDVALAKLGDLQRELDKANNTANELQRALDDCLARHANGPTDDLALDKLHRVIAQRNEALAHVGELKRLLAELEDNYRKNLDQWEQQTQRDEKEIHDSKIRLEEERKRNKDLTIQLGDVETTLQAAENRAVYAEARSTTWDIQKQQLEQDLDHSSEDKEELEAICERLRAECLRLGGMIIACRNEVIRLGGKSFAPDGTVQGEDGWPDGAPYPGPDPSNITSAPLARPQPAPEDPDTGSYNPIPYPAEELRRLSSRASDAYQPCRSDSSCSHNDISIPEEPLRPSSLKPRPARRFRSPPPIYTGPAMSTQTNPRSTRNPLPDYGGPRSGKRKAESLPENEGPSKKMRFIS